MKKKKMTEAQEFEIMKLVLDKFLWLGFVIMAFGLFAIISDSWTTFEGFAYMVAGALVLVLFKIIIVKEYEVLRK